MAAYEIEVTEEDLYLVDKAKDFIDANFAAVAKSNGWEKIVHSAIREKQAARPSAD